MSFAMLTHFQKFFLLFPIGIAATFDADAQWTLDLLESGGEINQSYW